jgi:hypothetical protein
MGHEFVTRDMDTKLETGSRKWRDQYGDIRVDNVKTGLKYNLKECNGIIRLKTESNGDINFSRRTLFNEV